MNTLSTDELKRLVEERDGPFVTITLPTQRAGLETRQNPIRYRKLLRDAEERLTMNGMRAPDAVHFMQPARKLLEDTIFWQHQQEGLVVFVSPRMVRYFNLPAPQDEMVVVGERYYIKPILRILSAERRIFILTLSQNRARLLRATADAAQEVALKDTPGSIEEVPLHEGSEKQLQFRTAPGSSPGRGNAIFHGQGSPSDIAKERMLHYTRLVQAGVSKQLAQERAPLVFAGVDYLFAIYKDINTYPHLADQPITGNVDTLSVDELRRRAWEIVQPLFTQEQQQAAATYRQLANTPRASNNVVQVAPAAYHGRVELLFVQNGVQQWGVFAPEVGAMHAYDAPHPGSEDMLDFAALHTLLNGGAVYAVDAGQMPNGSSVAAVYRY